MNMIFKQSSLIIALSIGLQLQSGNASAFDLSDVTNAVDQVNSVAKQLNTPQPLTPIKESPSKVLQIATIAVPAEFQGNWGLQSSDDCKNESEGKATVISKDSINGYEWHSEIKSIKWITQPTILEVIASDCEGEECSNPRNKTWTLSDSGNSLSISDGGKVIKYSRCGSATVTNASSQEIANKEVLFSCTTKKGKTISLTKSGNIIQYSFGLPNKPELVIDTPEDKIKKDVESRDYFGVTIPKDKLSYYVNYQKYKDDTEESGVIVITGTKRNEVLCDNSKPHFAEGMLEFITGDKYESEYKVIY